MRSPPSHLVGISTSRLRAEVSGRVIVPDDPAYDQARTVFYGGFDQRRPAVIIRAADGQLLRVDAEHHQGRGRRSERSNEDAEGPTRSGHRRPSSELGDMTASTDGFRHRHVAVGDALLHVVEAGDPGGVPSPPSDEHADTHPGQVRPGRGLDVAAQGDGRPRPPGRPATEEAGRVIPINTFQVAPQDADALLAAWAADAAYLKQQPGFISAQLHRGIAGSGVFCNLAVWESVAAFRDAFGAPQFQATLPVTPTPQWPPPTCSRRSRCQASAWTARPTRVDLGAAGGGQAPLRPGQPVRRNQNMA